MTQLQFQFHLDLLSAKSEHEKKSKSSPIPSGRKTSSTAPLALQIRTRTRAHPRTKDPALQLETPILMLLPSPTTSTPSSPSRIRPPKTTLTFFPLTSTLTTNLLLKLPTFPCTTILSTCKIFSQNLSFNKNSKIKSNRFSVTEHIHFHQKAFLKHKETPSLVSSGHGNLRSLGKPRANSHFRSPRASFIRP